VRGQAFIDQIFNAQAAQNGGVVRRKISAVGQFASEILLMAEVQRRGFHMVVSGDQFVIFCNAGRFDLVR
jgi:hypothetical protein